MKKLVAVAVIPGLLSVLGAQAASAQLPDLSAGDLTAGVFPEDELTTLSSGGYPFAVGGGKTMTHQFAFSARNGPTGPSGYAVIKTELYEAQGHVMCYSGSLTNPSVASFAIQVDKGSGFFAEGGILTMIVVDSGQPGGTGDAIFFYTLFPCIGSDFFIGGGPVVQGNIVVKA